MYTFHTLMCICSLGLCSFQTCQPDELLIANNRWAGSHTTGKQAKIGQGEGEGQRGMASKRAAHCAISMRRQHMSLCNYVLAATCSHPQQRVPCHQVVLKVSATP